MKYHIDTTYAWYDHHDGSVLILIYFIQNVPFTFDELPEIAKSHPEVIKLADEGKRWTPEDLYRASSYLMLEECHPMIYELEIENPELYTKTIEQYQDTHMKDLVSTLDKHIQELDDFDDEQIFDLLTNIVGDA